MTQFFDNYYKIKVWLENFDIYNFTIDDDLTVEVKGN